MSKIIHPKIELVATSSLNPNPRNARTHTDKQVSQIAASIERFGWLVPIVVDDANMIAAGHGRWLAAKKLGLALVPTIKACFLTDADRRAFALAENRIAELSGWDEDLLAEELTILFDEVELGRRAGKIGITEETPAPGSLLRLVKEEIEDRAGTGPGPRMFARNGDLHAHRGDSCRERVAKKAARLRLACARRVDPEHAVLPTGVLKQIDPGGMRNVRVRRVERPLRSGVRDT